MALEMNYLKKCEWLHLAPGIDPQLRMARDEITVPRWTRDTWTAFRDSIAEQMWADYELQV